MRACLLGAVLLLGGLASCSVRADLSLQPDGGMAWAARVQVTPEARAAWSSLRDLDRSLPGDPLDPGLWRRNLPAGATAAANGLVLNLVWPPSAAADAPRWGDPSGAGVRLTFDRAALRRLAGGSGWSASPALALFLPPGDTPVSAAEYRDLLAYTLGSQLSEAAALALVDASTVELSVTAPRDLKAAPGALKISGPTAVYRWPLARVLSLDPPLTLRLDF